jgi:hypothetical protein
LDRIFLPEFFRAISEINFSKEILVLCAFPVGHFISHINFAMAGFQFVRKKHSI